MTLTTDKLGNWLERMRGGEVFGHRSKDRCAPG